MAGGASMLVASTSPMNALRIDASFQFPPQVRFQCQRESADSRAVATPWLPDRHGRKAAVPAARRSRNVVATGQHRAVARPPLLGAPRPRCALLAVEPVRIGAQRDPLAV